MQSMLALGPLESSALQFVGITFHTCSCVCNKKETCLATPPTGAFQDQCKQTMINKYSNKYKKVKNLSWQEAESPVDYLQV